MDCAKAWPKIIRPGAFTALRRGEAGLTLLEVVLAFTLLGLLLIPAVDLLYTSQKAYTTAGRETLAVDLAQGMLEKELLKSYDALASRGPEPYPDPGFARYQVRVSVGEYDPVKHLKEVTVTVFQQVESDGASLVTLVAK